MSNRKRISKRFLPRKKGTGGQGRRITHKQVAEAIRAFREQGGLIQNLPPQQDERRPMVRSQRDSMFEQVNGS